MRNNDRIGANHGYLDGMWRGPGGVPVSRGFDEYSGFMSGTHRYWVTEQRSKLLHNGEPDDTTGHTTELDQVFQ